MTSICMMVGAQLITISQSCGYQPGDFVIKLCETLLKGQNFKMYFDNWFAFLELQLLLKSWNIWNAAQPCARAQGCVHDDLRADGLRKGWQFRVGTWNVDSLTGRSGEVACMVILAQTTGQTEISQVMETLDGTLDHRILQKSCSCVCAKNQWQQMP